MEKPKIVEIKGDYITLGQLLKKVGLIDHGGEAKEFLLQAHVVVDGVEDNRRGRKLYPAMQVMVGAAVFLITADANQ